MLTFTDYFLYTFWFNTIAIIALFIMGSVISHYYPRIKYKDAAFGLICLLMGTSGALYLFLKFFNYLS